MKVGVVGLGLIGGSLCKAYKFSNEEHTVYGYDIDNTVVDFAIMAKVIDGKLDDEKIKECDLILIAVYPEVAISYLKDKANLFSKDSVVIDCCGTKEKICEVGFSLAKDYGFTFIGGHPMAGTHNSGFLYSTDTMFNDAPMVIVPPTFDDIDLLDKVKHLLAPARFGKISVTTAKRHDEMIAFTSQLAHIVSNAYIKSPAAKEHSGFSAGSYKDLTRVAWLNPNMWTQLFLENKDNLLNELDVLINNLMQYKTALENEDSKTLCQLLEEGRLRKKEVDG